MLIGVSAMIVRNAKREVAFGSGERPVDQAPTFKETWSYGYGDAKVVRIPLQGVIMRGRRERLLGYAPDMVEKVLAQIRCATLDEEAEAILLEIDSPGGAVTPSDEIYEALLRFKATDTNRYVFVFVRDLCASGAYYASMAGDYVMAEPTALVGSVGVIMETMNLKGLGDKLGLKTVTIASGANKDMLNPFKEINSNQVAMIQAIVDETQNRFASIVMQARGLENRDLLDGRILTARQAKQEGFVDAIGYWDDALDVVRDVLGVEDVYVVRYEKKRGFLEELMEAKTPHLPSLNVRSGPRLMSIWNP